MFDELRCFILNTQKSAKQQVSILYLTYLMCFSVIDGVLPLYLDYLKIPKSQIGLILGIGAILSVVTTTVWGILNDFTKLKKYIFPIIGITLGIVSILFGFSKQFLLFFLLKAVFDSFASGILPLLDKRALWIQEAYNIPYTKMRVFGSLGYAIVLFPVMFLIDRFDSYNVAFVFATICMITFSIVGFMLGNNKAMNDDEEKPEKFNLFHEIKTVLAHPSVRILLLIYMLVVGSENTLNSFQGIHLVDALHAPANAISYSVFIGSFISEIPMMMLAPKLHEKFGWWRCVFFAVVIIILRYSIEFFAPNWIVYVSAKLLHGGFVVLLTSPILMLLKRHVKPAVFATAITLLASSKALLQGILSFVIGGLNDLLGTTYAMYYVVMPLLVIALVLLWIYRTKYYAKVVPEFEAK